MAIFTTPRLGLGLASALAAFGLWAWIGGLRAENAELRRERLALRASIAEYDRALQDNVFALTALEASEARVSEREAAARRLREAALRAAPAEDAPVAGVLARALDALRSGEGGR